MRTRKWLAVMLGLSVLPGIVYGVSAPKPSKGAWTMVQQAKSKLTKQPKTSTKSPLQPTQAPDAFDIICAVINTHRAKVGLSEYSAEECASQAIRYDYGFFLDAVVLKRDGKMTEMAWDVTKEFFSMTEARAGVNAMTVGWSDGKVIAAGHGVAMTDLVGNVGGPTLTAAAELAAGTNQELIAEAYLQKLAEKKGALEEKLGMGASQPAELPNLTAMEGDGPQSGGQKMVETALGKLKASGVNVDGAACGRGWQTEVVGLSGGSGPTGGQTTAGNGGVAFAGGEGGGGGSGGKAEGTMFGPKGPPAGGGGQGAANGLAQICGEGTYDKGWLMDLPGKNSKNAFELLQQTNATYEEAKDALDLFNDALGNVPAYGEAAKEKKELVANLKEAGAQQEAATALNVKAQEQGGAAAAASGNKATKEEAKKTEKEIVDLKGKADELKKKVGAKSGVQDGGTGVDGAGAAAPICTANAMAAASYCGVGGTYAVMKYVYKEDIYGDLPAPPSPEMECQMEGMVAMGVGGEVCCKCEMGPDGGTICDAASCKAPAWALDWSKIVPFLPDVGPDMQGAMPVQATPAQQMAVPQQAMPPLQPLQRTNTKTPVTGGSAAPTE
ncbi:MAG: hypothetical protein HY696_06990 [Deltaproteobacteria bacterium]|nr:hypothetical protein [Deltaproteobacteria bacterium]